MSNDEPRAYTAEEMRKMFLSHLKTMASYWAHISIRNDEERAHVEACGGEARWRTEGMLFSFLVTLDGGTNLPAFDLIPSPHPEDEAYHRDQGENWWAPIVINECQLHDELHSDRRTSEPPREYDADSLKQAITETILDAINNRSYCACCDNDVNHVELIMRMIKRAPVELWPTIEQVTPDVDPEIKLDDEFKYQRVWKALRERRLI